MRILLLIDSLGSGGAQRQLVLLFNQLRARGVDVVLTYYQDAHHFLAAIPANEHARVQPILRRGGESLLSHLFRLGRHIKHQPDGTLVVSFLRGPAVRLLIVRSLLGIRHRWILSERSSSIHSDSLPRRLMYLAACRQADRVVANSMTALAELRNFGVDPEKLAYIPNGIVPLPSGRQTANRERRQMLLVGSISRTKNHLFVIRQLARLSELAWDLHHVGRIEDQALFAEMRKELELRGVVDRVTFHGEQRDLSGFYANAHVLVHASTIEGFPNVLLEAWLHGCPVLVSDTGDLPHLVSKSKGGRVFELKDDGTSFVSALKWVLSCSESDLAKMGNEGREHVLEAYDIAHVARAWLHVAADPSLPR